MIQDNTDVQVGESSNAG